MEQYRNRPKHLCSLENDELIQVCTQWIQWLIDSGGRKWVLSVPAKPNSDPDLVLTELVERFKEMQEPVSAPSVPALSENEYIDLSDLSEEDKKKMVTGFAQTVSKETMKLFYSLGLKTHIQCSVVNEPTDELFEFLFRKLPAPEAGQTAGVQWVCAFDDFPVQKIVVAKSEFKGKLLAGTASSATGEGIVFSWQDGQVIFQNGDVRLKDLFWLDESRSSLSTAKKQELQELHEWKEAAIRSFQSLSEYVSNIKEEQDPEHGFRIGIMSRIMNGMTESLPKNQETAIAFAIWTADNSYSVSMQSGMWYRNLDDKNPLTGAQLYALFLQSQTK